MTTRADWLTHRLYLQCYIPGDTSSYKPASNFIVKSSLRYTMAIYSGDGINSNTAPKLILHKCCPSLIMIKSML